ncbi:MAG: Gfo/Idh/MocA family oxidoreductase [Firmicutes bacterium]|nr:Gfo/Idh/MocA family oxidoreductase [Bacillota bacterium]
MDNKIKLGIIGCGDIATKKFINAIEQNNNVELISVCDVVKEKAERLYKQKKARSFYMDYNEMLEKEDMDAVIISTPHSYHAGPAIGAAKAGKHILLEKPMAVNIEEVDAIIKAVKENNVKFVPLPFVHSPVFFRCKKMIDEGCIGDVAGADAISISGGYPPSPWYLSKNAGVGAIADLGIYSISTIIALMGHVKKLWCVSAKTVEDVPFGDGVKYKLEQEDCARLMLLFSSGKIGSVTCGWAHGGGTSNVTVYGKRGILILNGWENNQLLYSANGNSDPVSLGHHEKVKFLGINYNIIENLPSYGGPAVQFLVDAIRTDKDLSEYIELNRHIMDVILKSSISCENGTVVEME